MSVANNPVFSIKTIKNDYSICLPKFYNSSVQNNIEDLFEILTKLTSSPQSFSKMDRQFEDLSRIYSNLKNIIQDTNLQAERLMISKVHSITQEKVDIWNSQAGLLTEIFKNRLIFKLQALIKTSYKIKLIMGCSALFTAFFCFLKKSNAATLCGSFTLLGFCVAFWNHLEIKSLDKEKKELIDKIMIAKVNIFDKFPINKKQIEAWLESSHCTYWSSDQPTSVLEEIVRIFFS